MFSEVRYPTRLMGLCALPHFVKGKCCKGLTSDSSPTPRNTIPQPNLKGQYLFSGIRILGSLSFPGKPKARVSGFPSEEKPPIRRIPRYYVLEYFSHYIKQPTLAKNSGKLPTANEEFRIDGSRRKTLAENGSDGEYELLQAQVTDHYRVSGRVEEIPQWRRTIS